MKRELSKIIFSTLVGCFMMSSSFLYAYDGSIHFSLDQRFFNDDRFGNVNGFSEWWAPHIDISVGLMELGWGLEPILGFGYMKNESTACAVESDGFTCLTNTGGVIVSEDRFKYQLISASGGLQWKAWEPNYFPVVPLSKLQLTSRYSRVRKQTSNISERKLVTGVDWGLEIFLGAFFSFLDKQSRKNELNNEWEVKDMGLSVHGRYLPSGWLKRGLGNLENSGGWSFGLGVMIDW